MDYPNLSLIVAYKGIVQQGTQPGMDDTVKHQVMEESLAYINGDEG